MIQGRRGAVVVVVALAASAAGVVLPGVASAASCRVMIVENDPPVGLTLTPRHLDVAYGGCVQFSDNAVGTPVRITVAGGYQVDLSYGETTGPNNSYHANIVGTHDVTASNGAATAKGSITVAASPSPSPSSSPSSHSPSSSPQPRPSSSSSSGPQVAPTPRQTTPPSISLPSSRPLPSAGSTSLPAVPTPSLATPLVPAPSPSSTPAAVVAGPVQPPTGRDLGLPAALAALALVGVSTALLRVLLANAPPVDGRRTVGGNA